MVNQIRTKMKPAVYYPPYRVSEKERARVWLKVWGMWKNKKPDPIKVMKKLRREWDRKIL